MELWPAGPRRDIAHELLEARILVLEARIRELEAASRAVLVLPDTGFAMKDLEREAILQALDKVNWYQTDAARLLHLTTRVFNYRIKMLKITRPGGRWNRGKTLREPLIAVPAAVIVPFVSTEPETAGLRSPYYLYDADGAMLAVRSPSNDRQHRKRQEEQVVLMLDALEDFPERHRTKDLVAHLAARDARLRRMRDYQHGKVSTA